MKKFLLWLLMISLLFCQTGCASEPQPPEGPVQICLYGESHGNKRLMEKELALWQAYYSQGWRHLFIEFPYYTAQFLNIWMEETDDAILDALLEDLEGSILYGNDDFRAFLLTIKQTCPETVFHGTDVGHQHATTGQRYLALLESEGMTDSEEYALALENMEQGIRFYENLDHAYREECMTSNFIREFDSLEGWSIMGIYGSAHTNLEVAYSAVPPMAQRLREIYGDMVTSQEVVDLVFADMER